ncbi:PREDICTED: stress protein DDR48-like [Camelina sativa]|uniref:Stress protein DDR48-like n=1 Tax=Camelina sativa TaxID=90675 RepID=A0ABM1RPY4_CAMSA|nr:PREDICTED: stress protein DDR48-like [Camelina sativa]
MSTFGFGDNIENGGSYFKFFDPSLAKMLTQPEYPLQDPYGQHQPPYLQQNLSVEELLQSGVTNNELPYGGNNKELQYGVTYTELQHVGNKSELQYGGNNKELQHGGNKSELQYGGNNSELQYGGNNKELQYGVTYTELQHGGNKSELQYGGINSELQYGGNNNELQYGGNNNELQAVIIPQQQHHQEKKTMEKAERQNFLPESKDSNNSNSGDSTVTRAQNQHDPSKATAKMRNLKEKRSTKRSATSK